MAVRKSPGHHPAALTLSVDGHLLPQRLDDSADATERRLAEPEVCKRPEGDRCPHDEGPIRLM